MEKLTVRVSEVSAVNQILQNAVNRGTMRFDAWVDRNLAIAGPIMVCAQKKLLNLDKWKAKEKIDALKKQLEIMSKLLSDDPKSFTDDHKKQMENLREQLEKTQEPTGDEIQVFLDSDSAVVLLQKYQLRFLNQLGKEVGRIH